MNGPHPTQVLIVDDDVLIIEAIRDILENLGYNIVGEATNGQQAVEMTQTLQPDVILMDIRMPKMDGLEAAQQIQEHCPTPVVLLTAYDTQGMVEQAGAAGVGAFLAKPPDIRQMQRAITIAIARFDDIMELRRLNGALQVRNIELQETLAQVKILSGLLPICANCKKIRDDEGYWQDVALYIRDHSEAEFSHGLCPDCVQELYPDFYTGNE